MSRSMSTMANKAELQFHGKTIELPLIEGTEGEVAIDISTLRKKTGLITLDPGFVNTGSCRSDITFVDGEKGILRYRGYPIEDLAQRCTFLECAWLLLYGELPTPAELSGFQAEIRAESKLPDALKAALRALPRTSHPMSTLGTLVGALSGFSDVPKSADEIHAASVSLIAKLPILAAWIYRQSMDEPAIDPVEGLDYATNFLHMMFGTPGKAPQVDPVIAKALDLLLVLHADHEQNCSTSTVRMVGSSRAHLFAAIAGGIFALWGPLHGGANQKVVEMLEEIQKGGESATDFLKRAKDKGDTTRLMGFGHRVYKSYDPRAKILKSACDDVLSRAGGSSKLLEIAMELEGVTLKDDYFVSRSLYPNVDFYSGVIYKSLGIPTNMFTVMFALGRLPGWIAQWQEMLTSPDFRIGRPRQLYTGKTKR